MVRLRIDGIEIRARQGETILKAARRAKVHIPTLCHLSKLSPIASCRLCLVEERGSAGYLLSCQTPVKEGMEIATKSRALEEHRLQLMQFYAMNHPLECGVCDKSGECELQNRVHELRVNEQPFAAREKARALETWKGGISYDESLCIVCERCVRVCNELIGDSCLRVLPGGFSSRIVFKESSHCSECGECVAVCPVGALSSRAFHYTSNAWELKKHSSSCPHCALACPLEYETKNQGALSQGESQIYRISHDREFGALCKMGRYAFRNRKVMKPDTHAFANALEAFKKADTIAFSSYITNEEALILQKLKEEHGYRLYNPEALAFQTFARMMRASFGGSDETKMKSVEMSDCIVALGGRFYDEAPLLKSAMSQAQTRQGAKLYWLHPLEESRIKAHGMWRYEVGAEEGVVALLLASILEGCAVDGSVEGFLEELDWGYVSSESNLSEEELSLLRTSLTQASSPILVIGADLYAHPRATNIARMLGILQKHSAIKILLTP
ncbi:MAG: 4Fe-4S binding protein, partial [Wolinella succinogenes]|uniref:2Fe-2S iron-sulfur cluster-binding protein n=2 Tax=Wolinella succinogenes TaxID=844 RepID=UPI0016BD560C